MIRDGVVTDGNQLFRAMRFEGSVGSKGGAKFSTVNPALAVGEKEASTRPQCVREELGHWGNRLLLVDDVSSEGAVEVGARPFLYAHPIERFRPHPACNAGEPRVQSPKPSRGRVVIREQHTRWSSCECRSDAAQAKSAAQLDAAIIITHKAANGAR